MEDYDKKIIDHISQSMSGLMQLDAMLEYDDRYLLQLDVEMIMSDLVDLVKKAAKKSEVSNG